MLAIVIPFYKLVFFESTLKSLANQTNKNFKVYIGDDCSPEDCAPLLMQFNESFNFIYHRFENNVGGSNLTKQWDRCLALMENEDWFTILGDDDLLSENYVKTFYDNLNDINLNNSNVIKFSQCWIDESGNTINNFTTYNQLLQPAENLNLKLNNRHRSSLSEYIFKKSKYDKFGFVNIPLAWGSDDIAVLEFADNNLIYFIDTAKVLVRMSSKSISGRIDNQSQKSNGVIVYEKYLINNHYRILEPEYLKIKINNHLGYRLNDKIPLGFNILKLYLYIKDYKKIILLPMLYVYKILLPDFLQKIIRRVLKGM
jgi:hypothetical protein